MTTGSIVNNTLIGATFAGDAYHRVTRTWSGSDAPAFQPPAKQYKTISFPARRLLNGTYQEAFTIKKRVFADDPPKRVTDKKKGEHSYHLESRDIHETCLSYKYGGQAFWTNYLLNNYGSEDSVPFTANDQLALVNKLRSLIAGSDFNAGVSIAEAPKAFALIADSASRIAGALKSLRRGNIFTAANYLTRGHGKDRQQGLTVPSSKQVADQWLALQYGWKPLVEDAYNCATFLSHNYDYPRQYRVIATRYASGLKNHYVNQLLSHYPYGLDVRLTRDVSRSRRIRALITDVNVQGLSGLTDPASIAWEILPYSFVADWFIPVGSWLDALRLARNVTATYVTTDRSLVTLRDITYEAISGYNLSSYTFRSKPGNPLVSRFTFDRTVSTSLDVPLPTVKPIVKAASIEHVRNAVALLVSRR